MVSFQRFKKPKAAITGNNLSDLTRRVMFFQRIKVGLSRTIGHFARG
jgi:hypothetical protein